MKKSDSLSSELKALNSILRTLDALGEPQRTFVLTTACARFNFHAASQSTRATAEPGGGIPRSQGQIPSSAPDLGEPGKATPKEFVAAKRPSTDVQKVACLAFYLTHVRNVNHFKTGDVRKLSIEARIPMSNTAVAVMNATTSNRFLDPVGGGKKQLSILGEEVVNVLPDQGAVKIAVANHKPRKRTKRKGLGAKR